MAIFMSMLATVFYQATRAFRMARASVEIHQNARAAFNALLHDLAAAEFTDYATGRGYFAVGLDTGNYALATGTATGGNATQLEDTTKAWPVNGLVGAYVRVTSATAVQVRRIWSNSATTLTATPAWSTVPVPGDTYEIGFPMLTFTTLAPQLGARYAAPEAVQQLALVRYALEWDGGAVTTPQGVQRPTFMLMKRVRFPRTDDPNLDMEEFDWANLPLEYDPNDPNASQYAAPEPLAFSILGMHVRVFAGFAGEAESVGADTLTDDDGIASADLLRGRVIRIVHPADKEQALPILSNTLEPTGASTVTVSEPWTNWAGPESGWAYRIAPAWYQLGEAPATLSQIRLVQEPPAVVEVTLEITDRRGARSYTFTERYHVPGSQQ